MKNDSERNTKSNDMDTVVIGSQTWTKHNLNVDHFRDGEEIPEAKTNEEWIDAGLNKRPAWCYYDNNTENGKTFGKLYNWYAVSDDRGLAPEGYHIPDIDEWKTLFRYLGDGTVAGNSLMKDKGFSAVASGFRYDPDYFWALGDNASWWTSTESDKEEAIFCDLDFNMLKTVSNSHCPKLYGLSVRCVKDE